MEVGRTGVEEAFAECAFSDGEGGDEGEVDGARDWGKSMSAVLRRAREWDSRDARDREELAGTFVDGSAVLREVAGWTARQLASARAPL